MVLVSHRCVLCDREHDKVEFDVTENFETFLATFLNIQKTPTDFYIVIK